MSGSADAKVSAVARRAPTRRYEARRHAIIASAVEELNRKGMRAMTLGDVAARLSLVPTGVIYYFRNKEELAAACFHLAIERYNQLIDSAMSEADDSSRMEAFVRGYFDFRRRAQLGEAEEIAKFNDVRGLNSRPVLDAFVDMFRNARDLVRGPVDAPLSRIDRNTRTHLLMSEVFGTTVWIEQSVPDDYDRLADRMLDILRHGLVAPGASWPQFDLPQLDQAGGRPADASAELFLRAATELINEEGYHGASVERISARLNVSKGAFYHHNETKDELVVACFERTCEIMWRAIRAAESEGGSGLKVLAQISAALVHFQMAGNLPLLRITALTTVPLTMQQPLLAKFDRIAHRIASVICDGIADGSIRPVDVNVAAQMITGMINAGAELRDWAPGLPAEGAEPHYVRPLFEGMLSPVAGDLAATN
ncbi:TetR/AcrR family transcriptional regulator [Phenylobacterium deserti]|nr:TetR/AcrR family transcriptional regulator [Phenylobacterium deserti]